MSIVKGSIKQTHCNESPDWLSCSKTRCGTASNPTSWIGIDMCDKMQLLKCCNLELSVCPNLANRRPVAIELQDQAGCYGKLDCDISCMYDKSIFNDLTIIKEYKQKFGATADYNKVIMPHFCAQQTHTCPPDPPTAG